MGYEVGGYVVDSDDEDEGSSCLKGRLTLARGSRVRQRVSSSLPSRPLSSSRRSKVHQYRFHL